MGLFIGFAPAEAPRLVVLVVVDEPQGAYYGGTVAAPSVGAIINKSLIYLKVPPRADVIAKKPAGGNSD
jgi:cell division protein FtsI/penicillin-binding protein 2